MISAPSEAPANRSAKRALYGHFAAVARALGSGHRLELLELLAQGEQAVAELVASSGLPVANVSQHLQNLRRAGLVTNRREGKYIVYILADEAVVTLVGALQTIAGRHHEEAARVVDQYFRRRDRLEPVSRKELLRRKRAGAVIVIDVRPADEFAAGHIRGALNIPLKELERRLAGLPRGQEIVAYCRGPYCVMAFEAVARLRARGFKARRLQDGFPEWKIAGLPVETVSAA
jgi:ArsR family transcriptional regulator